MTDYLSTWKHDNQIIRNMTTRWALKADARDEFPMLAQYSEKSSILFRTVILLFLLALLFFSRLIVISMCIVYGALFQAVVTTMRSAPTSVDFRGRCWNGAFLQLVPDPRNDAYHRPNFLENFGRQTLCNIRVFVYCLRFDDVTKFTQQ